MTSSPFLPPLAPGYTPVPPGHVVSVVTYLDMRSPPPRRVMPPVDDSVHLMRLGAAELARYRTLFRQVGERWLWFSRLSMTDEALLAILGDARVEAYALRRGDDDIGLLELDFREEGNAELAFFGVVSEHVGTGLGRWLMFQALDRVWSRPLSRLHVHTCTLDHPAALSFYMRSGFVPYARAVEVAVDPRVTGALPRDAAPWVPVLE